MTTAAMQPTQHTNVAPAVERSPQERTSKLEVLGLRRRLGGRYVVDGVDLSVRRGEIVGLLGPNGAGKTVTFSMIVGLIRPTSGVISLDGVDVTRLPMHQRARRGLSYLPQERSVFRHLTAEDNVAVILESRGYQRDDARRRAQKLLGELGIRRLARVKARQLSGGEQRRLEVARCLAVEPRFLLVDEPFAGIDPITIEALHDILIDLRRRGIGILLTDHNVHEALALCDRAYVLFNGRVLAAGTAAELREDETVRQRFLGDNFQVETSCAGRAQ